MSYATGKYRGKATSGELGYSSTGKEQVCVQFEILDGPDEGRTIRWYGYFTEKTAERTLKALMECGWDGQDVSVLTGLGTKDVELVIDNDAYNGEVRQRVNWINSLRKAPKPIGASMTESDKRSFASKMKGLTLNLQKNVPSQVGTQGHHDDEDIPF